MSDIPEREKQAMRKAKRMIKELQSMDRKLLACKEVKGD